ncbi:MAG: T9SS type A sorting domain-containing protein [Bacteroides sp.]
MRKTLFLFMLLLLGWATIGGSQAANITVNYKTVQSKGTLSIKDSDGKEIKPGTSVPKSTTLVATVTCSDDDFEVDEVSAGDDYSFEADNNNTWTLSLEDVNKSKITISVTYIRVKFLLSYTKQGTIKVTDTKNNEVATGTKFKKENDIAGDFDLFVLAEPATGYKLTALTVNNDDILTQTITGKKNTYGFAIDDDDTKLDLAYTFTKEKTEEVTVTLNVTGSLGKNKVLINNIEQKSGANKVTKGETYTIKIEKAAGFELKKFTVGGTDKKAEAEAGFTHKFDNDLSIDVEFVAKQPEKVMLTVKADGANVTYEKDGSWVELKSGEIEKGSYKVKVEPKENTKVVDFVKFADAPITATNNIYTLNITAAATLEVKVKDKPAPLTLTVEGNIEPAKYKTEPTDLKNLSANMVVTFTFEDVPADKYVEISLKSGSENKASIDKQKVTIKDNATVVLKLIPKLKITLTSKNLGESKVMIDGTILKNGENLLGKGKKTIKVDAKSTLTKFEVGGADKLTDAKKTDGFDYDFQSDITINAEFEAEETVTVTLNVTGELGENKVIIGNSTLKAGADNKITKGEKTVKAVVKAGFELKKFTVGGTDKKAEAEAGFTHKFDNDLSIDVEFVAKQPEKVMLTVKADGANVTYEKDGSWVELKSGEIEKGSYKVKVEPKKPAEKKIKTVIFATKPIQPTGGIYTIEIDAAATLEVEVEDINNPATFALVVNAPDATVTVKAAGKTLLAADYRTIAKGTDLMFEVKAKTGKKIEKVEVTIGSAAPKMITLSKEGTFTQKMTDNITVTVKARPAAVEDAVLASVVVYPNPFVGQLFITNLAEVTKVSLINAQGVVIRTIEPRGSNELVLATEDIPAGIYVVVLEHADARKAIRIVK